MFSMSQRDFTHQSDKFISSIIVQCFIDSLFHISGTYPMQVWLAMEAPCDKNWIGSRAGGVLSTDT